MVNGEHSLLLLKEWKEILAEQRKIKNQRSAGFVGILVSGDDLARAYQSLQDRVWEIRRALFDDYYMGP